MTIEFSFVATPELGPKALRFLLWRRAGPFGPLAIILVVLVVALFVSDPAWRTEAYLLAGAAIMLFVIFLLAVAHRRGLRKRFFNSTTDHTVKVSMGEDGVAVTTALGSSTLPWQVFERLWTGKAVVLLFYNGWQYLAFPAEAIPERAVRFASSKIVSKRKSAGGHWHVAVFHGREVDYSPGLVLHASPAGWEVVDELGTLGPPGSRHGTFPSGPTACRAALALLRSRFGDPMWPCWGAGAPESELTELGYRRGELRWRWSPPGLVRVGETAVGADGTPIA